jgi:putative endonuclease
MKRAPQRAGPSKNTRAKGRAAEDIAANHLTQLGYSIVERNFQCRLGEIDIVATHHGDLVFIEVRSGNPLSGIDPAYSVDRRKQLKIIKAAEVYLMRCKESAVASRFDVALVTLGRTPHVEIIADAFRAGEEYM